jgi:hypothetical protein
MLPPAPDEGKPEQRAQVTDIDPWHEVFSCLVFKDDVIDEPGGETEMPYSKLYATRELTSEEIADVT